MPVHVENGPNTCVPKAGGDHGGVHALLDEEGHVAIAEIVKPHRLADGLAHRGLPVAGPETRSAEGSGGGRSDEKA